MVCTECGGEILANDAYFVNATKENVHIRRSECWRRRITDLERQLAEANHNWQTIVNLQAITIALREQQLAEAKP